MQEGNRTKRSVLGTAHLLGRFGACILAAVPPTLIPPLPLTALFTRRFQREERMKRWHSMVPWARFCRKYILKIALDVHGRENIPEDRRGHMFISNHQSYVDILVLMEALDTVSFLSKDLVRYIPLIAQHSYTAGTIFFDRRNKESRKRALDETLRMCKESTAVVVFPEGTRSADGNLRPKIYPRAMERCHEEGIRIIPVGLDGTFDVVPKSMDRVNLGKKVVVSIGSPLDPASTSTPAEWVDLVWGRVGELFEKSRKRRLEMS
ncbi:MAG: 1-acyl-sn-glycerol-3-phosphate acyltransferase [Deltaproteobacteria bacterium]|nr:MAG: 1-acyl-sn-glycerol-3-phosphate acyltransferase [Deltaproteobacteria bacterium]